MSALIHRDCGGEIVFKTDTYGQSLPFLEVVCSKCGTHLGMLYDIDQIESKEALDARS